MRVSRTPRTGRTKSRSHDHFSSFGRPTQRRESMGGAISVGLSLNTTRFRSSIHGPGFGGFYSERRQMALFRFHHMQALMNFTIRTLPNAIISSSWLISMGWGLEIGIPRRSTAGSSG